MGSITNIATGRKNDPAAAIHQIMSLADWLLAHGYRRELAEALMLLTDEIQARK